MCRSTGPETRAARCAARNLRELRVPKRSTEVTFQEEGNQGRERGRSLRKRWLPPGVCNALVREHSLGDTAGSQ